MSHVMDHVRELSSVIGPRPATTDAEARAAEYIEGVFKSHGLEAEQQEFDCPRTRSWAFVIYHILTLGAAVLSFKWSVAALVLALIAAVLYRLDQEMKFSLASILPKGPSQNIIARHVPHMRRGDRLQRVVIVAHYDAPKASLMASPSMAKRSHVLVPLTWWATVLTPVVIFIGVLPFAHSWRPWINYCALAAAVYVLVPLVTHVYSELFLPPTEGANHNASGVAALLGVMEETVPAASHGTTLIPPVRRGEQAAHDAGVVIEDALLEYRPVGKQAQPEAELSHGYEALQFEGLDDVDWETGPINAPSVAARRARLRTGSEEEPYTEVADDAQRSRGSGGQPSESWMREPPVRGQERLGSPSHDEEDTTFSQTDIEWPETEKTEHTSRRKMLFGRSHKRKHAEEYSEDDFLAEQEEGQDVSDWLGVDHGFSARKAGKRIRSWDNLDDDDGGFGFKGGRVGHGSAEGYEYETASFIRRRVTEGIDRALAEKEIWFVATGACDSGAWGMRALLKEHADELRDAFIIVIDGVGSGSLSFVTREGLARQLPADRRLVAQARRTAREKELPVTAATTRNVITDTLPALARRFKAMSVMAFDINGRLPDRGWTSDTIERVSETSIERAVTFVTELVRDL